MGVYLGEISIINDKFVNFKPFYEYNNGDRTFSLLSKAERLALLPESEFENINFYSSADYNEVITKFHPHEYFLLDFELGDLEDNLAYSGERNRTGYKIDISQLSKGKLRSLAEIGFCRLIRSKDIFSDSSNETIHSLTDFCKNRRLRINDPTAEGMKVVLEIDGEANIVLGPFSLSRRSLDSQLIVNTFSELSKYVIPALRYENGIESSVKEFGSYEIQSFVRIDNNICKVTAIDAAPKDVLLKEFRNTLGIDTFEDGKLNLSNIDNVIKDYSASYLVGDDIPLEIKQRRLENLRTLMTDEKNLNDTFGFIGETIASLLLKYKDNDVFEPILHQIANDADFMGQIQRINIINDKISEKESELNILTNQLADKQKETAEKDAPSFSADELIGEKKEELEALKQEIDNLSQQIDLTKSALSLQARLKQLNEDVDYKEKRERELDSKLQVIDAKLDGIFSNSEEKALNFAFDGMLSSRMLQTAAQWEAEQKNQDYEKLVAMLREIKHESLNKEELVKYLCEEVGKYRPTYGKNAILNIFICIAQGFLTVFSGEPGTGKTSICNIAANTLGLTLHKELLQVPNINVNHSRYISVSVERGWTSKRDFIGYYNPLTKKFDRSNRQLFDALNILAVEADGRSTDFPYLVLLDEANLSPMEYYWADFMNICDDLSEHGTVNLGEDYSFQITDSLRFVATINNDHTTEALSPRLIDRAWIIKLPSVKPGMAMSTTLNHEGVKAISHSSLMECFAATSSAEITGTAKEIYEALLSQLRVARIIVSPRADSAIRRYWVVAKTLFEDDPEYAMDASIVALDYAVSQRILPQINGSGDKFGETLGTLAKTCNEKNLRMSASILNEIIRKGEETMMYYQYFA